MSRRTSEPAAPLTSVELSAGTQAPRATGAMRATTTGTRRFAERVGAHDEDFFRILPRKLTVSALGMGTYLGDCTDEHDLQYRTAIRTAIASGVNLIDTASNYRCQRSERAVGHVVVEAIASGEVRRDEIVVCTKGGYVALDGAPPSSREEYDRWIDATLVAPGVLTRDELARGGHSISPRFLSHQLAQSRANLGLAMVDVYYVHNPEEQLLVTDRVTFRDRMRMAFELLEERAAAGEIGGYGCATWLGFRVPPEHRQHLTLADLVGLAREVGGTTHHFRAVQLPVSLAMPEAARLPTQPIARKLVPLLEAADALGIGVIASAPLMQGQLTANLPPEVAEIVPGCATDAQRALRFAASLPGVSAVLAGMRNTVHVTENLQAWHQKLA